MHELHIQKRQQRFQCLDNFLRLLCRAPVRSDARLCADAHRLNHDQVTASVSAALLLQRFQWLRLPTLLLYLGLEVADLLLGGLTRHNFTINRVSWVAGKVRRLFRTQCNFDVSQLSLDRGARLKFLCPVTLNLTSRILLHHVTGSNPWPAKRRRLQRCVGFDESFWHLIQVWYGIRATS